MAEILRVHLLDFCSRTQETLSGRENPDITRKLRVLWTPHVTSGLTENELNNLLENPDENIRSWTIQLLAEKKTVSQTTLNRFENLAKTDKSALVRLYLASAMLRLAPNQRWNVLENLVQKTEDATDHNIPLMLWYAAEPLADIDAKRALAMAEKAKLPKFLEFMKRKQGIATNGGGHEH